MAGTRKKCITEEERSCILSRRLDAHNLLRRLPTGSLLEAAGACGIQNTPHGSAELSLLARVDGLRPGEVERALQDRALMQAWSLRAAPHLFPASDRAVFTAGLLPPDENSLRFFIRGASEHLDQAGMTAGQLIDMIVPAIAEALDGLRLIKDDLGHEVADRLGPLLDQEQRAIWNEPDPFGRFGETLVRYGLYIASLRGAVCHGPRVGASYLLVRPDQWLGPAISENTEFSRADIVRRYLHCYGPSSPEKMAEWAGVSKEQASAQWSLVSLEMVRAGEGWLLDSDTSALDHSPAAEGTRLLPPHDPYLQMRDRDMLVTEARLRKRVWRATGSPGAVLHQGDLIGTWRSRKKGSTVTLEVTPFRSLGQSARGGIKEEAEIAAGLREARKVLVEFLPPD